MPVSYRASLVRLYHFGVHREQLHHSGHGKAQHSAVVPGTKSAGHPQQCFHCSVHNRNGSEGETHKKLLLSSSLLSSFKAVSTGLIYGENAYFKSGWNIMDGSLVIVSLFDTIVSVIFGHASKIFDILRVFRLVRALRPLRVINRAPGLKLVVQTLLSSLKPIGNIVLICCTFFIIFGILGVQVLNCTTTQLASVASKVAW